MLAQNATRVYVRQAEVQVPTLIINLAFVLRNLPERKASRRYGQGYELTQQKSNTTFFDISLLT